MPLYGKEIFMELRLYYKLGTQSRRAIRRSKTRYGRPYEYRPRGNLIRRLANETGQSYEQVLDQLMEERRELIRLGSAAAL